MTSAASLGDVLGTALRDTWPALRSWFGWLIALVVLICAGLILAAVINPPKGDTTTFTTAWEVEAGAVVSIGLLAAAFFAIASAVRTVRPEFQMTTTRFFGVLGWSLLSGLIVFAGLLLLVVPGLYLMVKVSLAPYFYLLHHPSEHNPIQESFALTRGNFWWTALLLFAVAVIIEIVAYAASAIVALLALIAPLLGLIALPLVIVATFAALQFSYIAYVHWTKALLAPFKVSS